MQIGIRVAAALLAACLPVAAQADWAPTRWDMSADQVRQVLPSATNTPPRDVFGDPASGNDNLPKTFLYLRVQRESRTYDVRLAFAGDRLKSVEMALADPTPQQCTAARSRLQQQLGTPSSGGEGEGGRYDRWNQRGSDSVIFVYRTDPAPHCTVLVLPDTSARATQ